MSALAHEKVWLDKTIYNDAERDYYESLSKASKYLLNNHLKIARHTIFTQNYYYKSEL